jgi:hypothetical protein
MCDPDQFSYELNKLGRFYNTALLAPERNGSGFSVIRSLVDDYHYPNLFQETSETDEMFTSATEKFGFRTNVKSRAIIIDKAKEAIRKGIIKLNSVNLINECLSFVYSNTGKPQHENGKHDDLVFAMMIALYTMDLYGDMMVAKSREDNSFYNKVLRLKKENKVEKKSLGGY